MSTYEERGDTSVSTADSEGQMTGTTDNRAPKQAPSAGPMRAAQKINERLFGIDRDDIDPSALKEEIEDTAAIIDRERAQERAELRADKDYLLSINSEYANERIAYDSNMVKMEAQVAELREALAKIEALRVGPSSWHDATFTLEEARGIARSVLARTPPKDAK